MSELRHWEQDYPEVSLPVAGDAITCGLRLELPRKQRRHVWAELGEDYKNKGTEGIVQVPVRACTRCGKDDR